MTQVDIINRITVIAKALSYTVYEEEVSEDQLSDTEMPAMLITAIETDYDKQLSNMGVLETYKISYIFKLERPSDGKVLSLLADKKREFIAACQNDSALQIMIQKDSFTPVKSNEANTVKQHSANGSKAVGFVLSTNVSLVETY
ncbi:MAG: hypothetical protein ACTSW1_08250 [Candidatus Hodarchaeales archaeon]